MTDKQGFEWLEGKLKGIDSGFTGSKLYKLLKTYLKPHSFWKDKPRGDARKGGLIRKAQEENKKQGKPETHNSRNYEYYE